MKSNWVLWDNIHMKIIGVFSSREDGAKYLLDAEADLRKIETIERTMLSHHGSILSVWAIDSIVPDYMVSLGWRGFLDKYDRNLFLNMVKY